MTTCSLFYDWVAFFDICLVLPLNLPVIAERKIGGHRTESDYLAKIITCTKYIFAYKLSREAKSKINEKWTCE